MKSWLSAMFGAKMHLNDDAAQRVGTDTARVEDTAWWHVMGYRFGPPRSLQSVERRFRRLVASAHPDRGGSASRMQQLIRARAAARRQLQR